MTEEKALSALAEKPLTIRNLLARVSSSKQELQILLMRMCESERVKFDIKSGRSSTS